MVGLGRHRVRVNCIAPGNIETPILEQTMDLPFARSRAGRDPPSIP